MYNIVFLKLCDRLYFGESCWECSGAKSRGYNVIVVGGKQWKLHVLLYEILVGPVPDGLILDHLCSNPGCVRPDHLEPVTQRENLLRGRGRPAENARKTHCLHGHVFDAGNTFITKVGKRMCRTCIRERMRVTRARKAA